MRSIISFLLALCLAFAVAQGACPSGTRLRKSNSVTSASTEVAAQVFKYGPRAVRGGSNSPLKRGMRIYI
ncbi:BQ2448_6557 [Microbotryum intermedium]|uniref:BQ2448_6557 protein n=1 Tax=Microbotryum intermedium TaxID=269621 RepID=A0A238FLT6_9BASI|nr:BQ2448_6557 [Microbotryum intermedium]